MFFRGLSPKAQYPRQPGSQAVSVVGHQIHTAREMVVSSRLVYFALVIFLAIVILLFCHFSAFLQGKNSEYFNKPAKTLWFTAVSTDSSIHLPQLKSSIHSAIHIHSIFPVILVSGNFSLLPDWLQLLSKTSYVGVIHHELSFSKRIVSSFSSPHPAYLRIDIPLVVKELRKIPRYLSLGIQFDYALYTDTDVLFSQSFKLSVLPLPRVLANGAEIYKGVMSNSGVLYMNISAMQAHMSQLLDFADSKNWSFPAVDQGLILEHFVHKLKVAELLPDSFNWKPYWGINPIASIVHFHGAKPGACAECFAIDSNFGSGCGCPAYSSVSGLSSSLYNLPLHVQSSSYAHYLGLYYHHQSLFTKMIYQVERYK